MRVPLIAAGLALTAAPVAIAAPGYPWLRAGDAAGPANQSSTIALRFAPPAGFKRVAVRRGSFAHWLRHLPLKPRGAAVRLHSGRLKPNQGIHAAVVAIDTGRRDLQQCADAVIRLRAEYLYARGRYSDIRFHFTSGDLVRFDRWAKGWRPRVRGNRVGWVRGRAPGTGRTSFRRYLRTIFTYAGTISVRREMARVPVRHMRIGDVFVQAGSPGHAVLVVDMARHPKTGETRFLLLQSYMPAQDMHVLRGPGLGFAGGGAWYSTRGLVRGAALVTPEWVFKAGDLRRFR